MYNCTSAKSQQLRIFCNSSETTRMDQSTCTQHTTIQVKKILFSTVARYYSLQWRYVKLLWPLVVPHMMSYYCLVPTFMFYVRSTVHVFHLGNVNWKSIGLRCAICYQNLLQKQLFFTIYYCYFSLYDLRTLQYSFHAVYNKCKTFSELTTLYILQLPYFSSDW